MFGNFANRSDMKLQVLSLWLAAGIWKPFSPGLELLSIWNQDLSLEFAFISHNHNRVMNTILNLKSTSGLPDRVLFQPQLVIIPYSVHLYLV